MRIKLKYKMQILSYFWAYDPTNIHYDEIYNVKIEIINTSFHGLEIQFHRNMQYMWRNYMKEYMKEVYKKGVKCKEKEEQIHHPNFHFPKSILNNCMNSYGFKFQ